MKAKKKKKDKQKHKFLKNGSDLGHYHFIYVKIYLGDIVRISVNNVELNYEIFGKGKPLILLHGNQEDYHIFDELIESLKDDFMIYAIDSRNHGKSSHDMILSYDDMSEDIYHFITKLNINKPHLLGFSDGGIVGIKLSILAPNIIDKLILCGTNYNPKGLFKSVRKELLEEYKTDSSPYIKLMIKEPKIKDKYLRNILNEILIIVGKNDCISDKHTQKLHQMLTNSQLIILDNHNHDSYIVHQDILKPHILEFLKK